MFPSPPSDSNPDQRDNVCYSRNRYQGQFTPGNLVFDANLQDFTQKVGYIHVLAAGDQSSTATASQKSNSFGISTISVNRTLVYQILMETTNHIG